MTMDTKNAHETDAASSSDGDDSITESSEVSLKKPPGEIDPSEYERHSDDNEELFIGDTSDYRVSQRNDLFQKGLDFEKNDKPDFALKCYLSCLKGLKPQTRFVMLPECLKNIADIYQAKGEYGNAIHFAQAEKLFYETALIETKEIQKKIEEITGPLDVEDNVPQDLNDLNIEAMRAEEYEHLARLCLDNKQADLALEYAGKCAKIRQRVYGSNHVKTRDTLDFFASIYAEVGKEQYSDSINAMANVLEGENTAEEISVVPEFIQSNNASGEPVSILRQRSVVGQSSDKEGATETDKDKKKVRFHESVDESIRRKRREELVSLTVTLLLLGVCFLILISLGVWLYCSMGRGQSCPGLEARLKSWMMTIRYCINRFTTTSNSAPKMEYSR